MSPFFLSRRFVRRGAGISPVMLKTRGGATMASHAIAFEEIDVRLVRSDSRIHAARARFLAWRAAHHLALAPFATRTLAAYFLAEGGRIDPQAFIGWVNELLRDDPRRALMSL
jgi:hypothetical protein